MHFPNSLQGQPPNSVPAQPSPVLRSSLLARMASLTKCGYPCPISKFLDTTGSISGSQHCCGVHLVQRNDINTEHRIPQALGGPDDTRIRHNFAAFLDTIDTMAVPDTGNRARLSSRSNSSSCFMPSVDLFVLLLAARPHTK